MSEPAPRIGSLPCFSKDIPPSSVQTARYSGYLALPRLFYEAHQASLDKNVKLKVSRGKIWDVKLGLMTKQKTIAFRGAGWADFVRDNGVRAGDRITFTMLSGSLFSVRFDRRVGDGDGASGYGQEAHFASVKQEIPDEFEQQTPRPPSPSPPSPSPPPPPSPFQKKRPGGDHHSLELNGSATPQPRGNNAVAAPATASPIGSPANPFIVDLPKRSSENSAIHVVLRGDESHYKLVISRMDAQPPSPAAALENENEIDESDNADGEDDDEGNQQQQHQLQQISVTLKASNMAPYNRLILPKNFARQWLPPTSTNVTLVDSRGTQWPMSWIVSSKRMLGRGWSNFVKHYGLEIGHRCFLSIVEPKEINIHVYDKLGQRI